MECVHKLTNETRNERTNYMNETQTNERYMQTKKIFEKWTLDKKLNRPRRWSDDNSSTFFLRNVEPKSNLLIKATA